MECLEQKIVDSNLLQFISCFLKSGIMEEGVYCETDQGTPQGGVLSPVLANVYLHYVLDLCDVIPHLTGYAKLVRYVDGFVVCFEKEEEARVKAIIWISSIVSSNLIHSRNRRYIGSITPTSSVLWALLDRTQSGTTLCSCVCSMASVEPGIIY